MHGCRQHKPDRRVLQEPLLVCIDGATFGAISVLAYGTAIACNSFPRAAKVADSAPRIDRSFRSNFGSPENHELIQRLATKRPHAYGQSECHRHIKRRPFLANIRQETRMRNSFARL
jgi:hypothetical protein